MGKGRQSTSFRSLVNRPAAVEPGRHLNAFSLKRIDGNGGLLPFGKQLNPTSL
jgi:hypothetical protein